MASRGYIKRIRRLEQQLKAKKQQPVYGYRNFLKELIENPENKDAIFADMRKRGPFNDGRPTLKELMKKYNIG